MSYKIGTIGKKFLKAMEVKHNYLDKDPGAIFGALEPDNYERDFRYSVYNPSFYPRAATEIMGKIFTSAENKKLQELIKELEREDASLTASASLIVSETIRRIKNAAETSTSFADIIENGAAAITCMIFEQIPPHALNLLGLIKIKSEYFPQSYNSFERMLEELNQAGSGYYNKNEIKKYFSEALKELEKLAKNIKNKKKPDETKKEDAANLGEENVKNENPSEQTPPNQNQSERDKNVPTDSNQKPEVQNNSENNDNANEPNNDDTSPNLQTLKAQAISDITAALNQTPSLTSSDLSLKYQNWENEISNFSDENQINSLKISVLFNIQDQRKQKIKKQTTEEVSKIINSNLQKAQNPAATIQDKKEALVENEQYEGQPAYEDTSTKEQTKNLKKEVARDNPTEYRDKIISELATKLKINLLNELELDSETKSEIEMLKNETDPDKLVEKEVKITQKISQQGATKKITTFKKKIEAVLESSDKTKIDELKKQLIEFIKSNNVYYQAKKSEAQQLLVQLESGSTINNSYSSESLPFSAQIGLGMGAVLAVLFFTFLI